MADQDSFELEIQQRLNAATERNQREQQQLQAQMTDLEQRHDTFAKTAERLTAKIIRPRIEKLATYFDNARMRGNTDLGSHRCGCMLSHTPRFPATVSFDIGVGHDEQIEKVLLYFDLEILPVFFKFSPHVATEFPLDQVDDALAAKWVEQQIVSFVDTYLQLEQSNQYQQESLVTDPVCGMRIRKSVAAANQACHGTTYYFCTGQCAQKFAEHPEHYVTVPQP